MKFSSVARSLSFVFVSTFVSLSAYAIGIGDKMPTLPAMKNVDGKLVSAKDLKGKAGTLVVFTCNHCPYVKAWEDRLVEIGNEAATKNISVIAINSNDPEAQPADGFEQMQIRAKEKGMKFPYVVDATSKVATAFGATKTPEIFLFDAKAKLIYHGAIDDNAEEPKSVKKTYLRDAIGSLVAAKPVAVAEAKAIGCGIKFRK